MSATQIDGGEERTAPLSERTQVPSERFYGLDGVRSTAMLLGVFYHLPIAMMAGGPGMGFDRSGSPKQEIDDWLHSFRMPLFFLISGFFANMILGKYGWRLYLTRRWWRIGAPLVLAFVAFVVLRVATDALSPASPGPFGFPPPAFPGPGGPGPGGPDGPGPFGPPGPFAGLGQADAVPTVAGAGQRAAPQGPQGPQAGAFGGAGPFGGPGTFVPGAFGPGIGGNAGGGRMGIPPGPPTGPLVAMPAFPSRTAAELLFGSYSRFMNLEHLWFLWYLLVFVTIGPCVAMAADRLLPMRWKRSTDRLGERLIRRNVMAIAFGLLALPALIHARGFMGWSLTNPMVFLAPFPDFLWQYQPDVPYYFLHFLAGWWLFRSRACLNEFGHAWLWSLVIGIAGFAASQALSDRFSARPDTPSFEWIRIGAFALYGVGAAYTATGFLGFFQRYLNRPSRASRYFADTALWIYLIHMPLIPYLIWWIQPSRTAWWGATLAGIVLVTGVALVLFELLVRPTPLVHVFGPASPRRPASEPAPAKA